MTNNVYISGSWKNRDVVRCLMEDIENWGYSIIIDWTNHRKKDILNYAHEYIKALKECDCMIYCMDGIKSIGKSFELGYATALDKPVGIYLLKDNVFGPNRETTSLDKILEKECLFIRANFYKILYSIDELKNWLLSIIPIQQTVESEIPESQSAEIVESEIPESQSAEIVESEIPESQSAEIVESEIPESQCVETIESDNTESQCVETIESDNTESQCVETVESDNTEPTIVAVS